jgi:hypothetical protein
MHYLLDNIAQDPAVAAAIQAHRARALNPAHPHQRGGAQSSDILMQMWEAGNKYYQVRELHSQYARLLSLFCFLCRGQVTLRMLQQVSFVIPLP